MRQEEPCSRDNMPWAGACKQAYARLSSAEPRGKSLKTMSLNMHKESSEVPLFGMKPEILVSQSTILWQAFSSQLSESQSSGNRLAMQRKMDQASWVFLLVRWKACWRGGGQFAMPSGVGQARGSCSPGAPSSLAMLLNSVSASGNHGHACNNRSSSFEHPADMTQSCDTQARHPSDASHSFQPCGGGSIASTAQKSCATTCCASLQSECKGMTVA